MQISQLCFETAERLWWKNGVFVTRSGFILIWKHLDNFFEGRLSNQYVGLKICTADDEMCERNTTFIAIL